MNTKGLRYPLLNFLYNALKNPAYAEYITWKDYANWIFKITDPQGLARLWGRSRGHKNVMTYEKMSRALRHYYVLKLLKKVNIRGCYQFTQLQHLKDQFDTDGFAETVCQDPLV